MIDVCHSTVHQSLECLGPTVCLKQTQGLS